MVGYWELQDYRMTIGGHRRVRDPDLGPFLIEGKSKTILFCILILFPVIITTSIILSVIFLDQRLVFFLLSSAGILCFFVAIFLTKYTYGQLKRFRLTGSVVQDLYRLIESLGFRIQAAIYPLIFLLFIFSLFFSGGENNETSELISSAVQLFGAVIPFFGVILILNTFLNLLNEANNRISSLADRTPDETFRMELKKWGRTLGFQDVKIRLADLQPNYYGRVAVGAKVGSTVYIGYSKIAQFQAEPDQSLVYCVREICRLSLEKRMYYYLLYSFHNLLFTLFLGLSGILIFSISLGNTIIHEANVLFCVIAIIILLVVDALIKAYIGSFDILLELTADQKTVQVLTTESRSAESIRRSLRLTEEIDPLMTAYLGFKFRRLALLEDDEKKSTWDDL